MTGRHVVVAGGGITGLAAAYRLTLRGAAVTLVEPGAELGGKLRTSVFAGRPVDEGADAFLLRVPWALQLCRDLQIDDELISPAERSAFVATDGGLRRLPAGQVLGVPTDLDALAASGIVSATGVARAAEDLERPADPADPALVGADVAIAPYLRRRLGDEVFDRLVDPLVGGINAGDTERLSLAAVVAQIDAAARSGDPSLIRSCRAQREVAAVDPAAPIFAAPLGGMGRFIDALTGLLPELDVRLGRRVAAVAPAGPSGVEVVLDDGRALAVDGVVLACPAAAAAAAVARLAPDAAALLAAIEYASVSLVTLGFARADVAHALDGSGLLVPRDQHRLLTACSFATSKWAQLRDPDRDDVILRASAGRHGDDRQLGLDDRDLVARLLDDLDAVLGLHGAPTEVRVNRWPASFPQYAPDHLDRVDRIDAALRAATPRVVLAGAAYRGLGVPACIRQGLEAADRLVAPAPDRSR
ncbi:MAG: Protoporphyrinogen oxidase [Acidimicrobiales bacterium]|nr:Protoporphyrinogen oxidase [Acidimicrobiales bacterium]